MKRFLKVGILQVIVAIPKAILSNDIARECAPSVVPFEQLLCSFVLLNVLTENFKLVTDHCLEAHDTAPREHGIQRRAAKIVMLVVRCVEC